MKNTIYIIIAMLCTTNLFAQKHILTDSKQIADIMQVQQKSWNEGDLEGFMATYWRSDSLMFIGKKGITKGWQQTLDNYKKSYPDKATMGQLNFDILSIDMVSKDAAYVIGRWHLTRDADKGNLEGHFTLLFKKINNRWFIVSDHSS